MERSPAPPCTHFPPYSNEPFTDFSNSENSEQYRAALAQVDEKIKKGELYAAPIVGWRELEGEEKGIRRDPSKSSVVIGTIRKASVTDVAAALELLEKGRDGWEFTPALERAKIIYKAGEIIERDKFALSALITREVGKSWAEADADVAEAVDFCKYYAIEMMKHAEPVKTMEVQGEDNHYLYQPRGIVAVIAPWNFPLAIPLGMTVAALVTGNVAILKPAEQSSIIGFEIARILQQAGVPGDAFALLPGDGEVVGEALVQSPKVSAIVFTGSRDVGLNIIRKSSTVQDGQEGIKRVICELGGKNAIIVDSNADLDKAARGIVQSAFGFGGQKCSACSRVIVVGDAYEPLLEKVKMVAESVVVGDPVDPSITYGPVVDEAAQSKILSTIERAERSEKLLFKGEAPEGGCYVPPTIFRDVDTSTPLWNEEIFGPVVACMQVKSFDEALAVANRSQYALTGGVFSSSRENLDKARARFKVGNLYLNRKITGALVGRQPFGGFKMSGVGSKAGGKDYLLQFLEPRTITESL